MLSALKGVYSLLKADFLERVRRYSFMVVVGLTVFAGYMLVPPSGDAYNSFVIGGYRGYYNSAWIGTVFGILAATLLSLIGFYLVKNSIHRDYQTRVGQIIATTPVSGRIYVLGKWLSNLCVLTLILAILTLVAPIMQLVRAEVSNFDLWALLAPIWIIALPTLAAVSAVAVIFECLPLLRGTPGNVIYFFLWFFVLMFTAGTVFFSGGDVTPHNDFPGLSRVFSDMHNTLASEGVDTSEGTTDIIVPTGGKESNRFVWNGLDWTIGIALERLVWFVLAVALALCAALPFDRFDPARRGIREGRFPKSKARRFRKKYLSQTIETRGRPEIAVPVTTHTGVTFLNVSPKKEHHRVRFWALLSAELKLMARGHNVLWYLIAVGIMVTILFVPLDLILKYFLPAAMLWPIALWSSMGNREMRHQMHQIAFSAAHPLRSRLLALWMAGVVIAVFFSSSYAVRLIFADRWENLIGLVAGVLFVPALALALGVWSNGRRLFEIVYVILWYLGIVAGAEIFDFLGTTDTAAASWVPLFYFCVTGLLLVIAVAGRKKQLRT